MTTVIGRFPGIRNGISQSMSMQEYIKYTTQAVRGKKFIINQTRMFQFNALELREHD
jgi:hypothetical protein